MLYSRFVLVIYFIHSSVYMSIHTIYPSPSFPPGNHKFVFYICDSVCFSTAIFFMRLWRSLSQFHFMWEHLGLGCKATRQTSLMLTGGRAETRTPISWASVQGSSQPQFRNPRRQFCLTHAETSQSSSLGGYFLPQQQKMKLYLSPQCGLHLSFYLQDRFCFVW